MVWLHCLASLLRKFTCGYVIGANFLSRNFSIVPLSSRKSSLVPTSIIGVLGQWWRTSGYHCNSWKWTFKDYHLNVSAHCSWSSFASNMDRPVYQNELKSKSQLTFARTFSKEAGLTSEKQMRKTSVCG